MEREKLKQQWKDRRWYPLLEHPIISEFIFSYNNESTILTLVRSINYFEREVKKFKADFEVSDLFSLSPVEARRLIWRAVQGVMNRGKTNRIALQVKSFVTLLYNFVREEEGLQIVWKRRHSISVVPVRDKHVPTHEEIYAMVDHATHLREKAIILLSYHSGLKGNGIDNLNVGDLGEQLKKFKETGEVPLVIKITARIYPKRFRSTSGNRTWYPALCDRDCADLLLKYYEKERRNASDDEPFFITRRNKRMGKQRISKQIRYLVDKMNRNQGILGRNTYAMLLRDAFYNRLIKGNMKDIYREFLMGHNIGMRGHYFSWAIDKDEIIAQYLKCGFNRTTENNEVKKTVEQQRTEIEKLKKQVEDQQKVIDMLNPLISDKEFFKLYEELRKRS